MILLTAGIFVNHTNTLNIVEPGQISKIFLFWFQINHHRHTNNKISLNNIFASITIESKIAVLVPKKIFIQFETKDNIKPIELSTDGNLRKLDISYGV